MKAITKKGAYEELANAIVVQAVEDYRDALSLIRDESITEQDYIDAQSTIRECERFFRSDYYRVFTDVDGEYLIKMLQEEVEDG